MYLETLTTHQYGETLAQAFYEITDPSNRLDSGSDVIEKLQNQMQSGENIFDAYVT